MCFHTLAVKHYYGKEPQRRKCFIAKHVSFKFEAAEIIPFWKPFVTDVGNLQTNMNAQPFPSV